MIHLNNQNEKQNVCYVCAVLDNVKLKNKKRSADNSVILKDIQHKQLI